MREIHLTDKEATYLIQIIKQVFKKYKVDVKPGNSGEILLKSHDEHHNFVLNYYTPKRRNDKMSIHIRGKRYKSKSSKS
nr:hypothetical protein [Heyndrickxia oleronia]